MRQHGSFIWLNDRASYTDRTPCIAAGEFAIVTQSLEDEDIKMWQQRLCLLLDGPRLCREQRTA